MPSTVRDLVFVLQTYFTVNVTLSRALYVLFVIFGLWPLWRLHLRQMQDPRQRQITAWSSCVRKILGSAVSEDIRVGDVMDYGLHGRARRNRSEGTFHKHLWPSRVHIPDCLKVCIMNSTSYSNSLGYPLPQCILHPSYHSPLSYSALPGSNVASATSLPPVHHFTRR